MATYDLGYLGGGQLARMSIQAAQRMGLRCLSLDPGEVTPASQISPAIQGALDDPSAIAEVFSSCEFVTLENEFIPATAIRSALSKAGRPASVLIPGVETLEVIQDKLTQRLAYARAGVSSPYAVSLGDGGVRAKAEIGFPMVLKARFGGYDGKGTRTALTEEDFEQYRPLWAAGGWLAESFVPFRRELAVMVVRSGAVERTFATVESVQTNHVCDLVFPCGADASAIAIAAVRAVGGQGLYGVELFEDQDGQFSVNEIAPRPHNSGHYTMDGWSASQFQVHVAAVVGLALPSLVEFRPVIMANLLGVEGANEWRTALHDIEDENVRLHWYGKAESRPGRKMGHLNYLCSDGSVENHVQHVISLREKFLSAWR
ncbi:MAG: 5-(carboxyamino)imidazole ribonucleotide synthase [Fimbriimonas sp.]